MARRKGQRAFSTLKAGGDSAAVEWLNGLQFIFNFQYPQSGSRLCRAVPWKTLCIALLTFSTLKAGRDSAAYTKTFPLTTHRLPFSTPKADPDSAATCRLRQAM